MTAKLCRGSPARRSCFSSRRWWFTAVPALLCTFPATWHNVHTAESTHAHPPAPSRSIRKEADPNSGHPSRASLADKSATRQQTWNNGGNSLTIGTRERASLFSLQLANRGVWDHGPVDSFAPSAPPAGSFPDSSTARLRWEGSPLEMWKWRAGTEMFAPEIQWRLGVPACQSCQCQRRELDDFSLHAPVIMARPVIIATASRPSLPFPHPSGCSAVQRRGNWRTEHTHRKRWLGKLGWLTECPFPLHPSPPTWRRSLIASPDLALHSIEITGLGRRCRDLAGAWSPFPGGWLVFPGLRGEPRIS